MLPRGEAHIAQLGGQALGLQRGVCVGDDDVVDLLEGVQQLEVGILRGQLQLQHQPVHLVDHLW